MLSSWHHEGLFEGAYLEKLSSRGGGLSEAEAYSRIFGIDDKPKYLGSQEVL